MKDIKIPKIESPSHGWAKISYYDLKGWNITLKEFSSFSFYNPSNACVYLEEDCDAPKLKKLLTEKGLRVSWKYTYLCQTHEPKSLQTHTHISKICL